MDTITHGIAGALIGKVLCNGEDVFALRAMNRRRVMSWAMMLGAIFPDSDTFRDLFSSNELLMITWHRSITHSLLCLPIFALLLAGLTRWITRWRKWDAPSFAALTGIYALGILSHILLDLVTSFGTMVWSPWKWSRPAWDLIFILDLTFTGILLVPQIVAWVQERPEKSKRRAVISFAIFAVALLGIQKILEWLGVAVSAASIAMFLALLAGLFFLPLVKKTVQSGDSPEAARRRAYRLWNRSGFAAACGYVALTVIAHHAAIKRVQKFAAMDKLDVVSLGALPFPPSLWRWDGLVRTPRGVYEVRMDLSSESPFETSVPGSAPVGNTENRPALEYRFYPDAYPNVYIEAAKELPEVQKFFWFARFPVTHFHKEGAEAVVEFSDIRFPRVRPNRPAPFTYRVRLGAGGNVLEEGWEK
jgi:membrane-bound metal-dependent hydrolase YbcI (DUF457 family)